ncbi:MAG: nitronate monooxygenase [Deltaproteobacteria bacterium]|nr:nitronate monooxygenase [Deltaproteobacteria bacterium]MBW1931546.1 nitronate monooxygenase [Deltaproteobacteria bacterium]MBW1938048.1 nitronate monooxygenase [Deltaproteobacteria bacterium]MBW1963644.1 nitronate monooxygenase [Deltaproteobacteria bacterium]MBW2349716.1 nitronate monooxygenase [Deltaproteobacteria bacterium]
MTEKTTYIPPPLTIGDVTVPIPIIQGGMGVGVSMAGLASAVARAGGIGIIASVLIGMNEKDFHKDPRGATYRALEKQIRLAKKTAPNGIIGVNIMVALNDYEETVRIAAKAGVDLIISGAGLPLRLPGFIPEGCNTKLVPIVSSGRAAKIICRRWDLHFSHLPDAIVVEGPKAGGHLGFKAEDIDSSENYIENLVPQVIEAVKPFEQKGGRAIPVIAAGGIYTGEDIYKFIQMGAAGVQMGTRFVATHECDASDKFKQAYINAKKKDVTIIKSPVGMPGRALKSKFIEKAEAGEKRPLRCVCKCIKTCNYPDTPYCIGMALINAQRGNINSGFVFCGSNVWRVNKIVSVQELMDDLVQGYIETAMKAAEPKLYPSSHRHPLSPHTANP